MVIANLTLRDHIACLVEVDPDIIDENRNEMLEKLTNDVSVDENGNCKYQEFINNGFVVCNRFGDRARFSNIWDKYYVTLFKLTQSNEKNIIIYERKVFYDDYLYYRDEVDTHKNDDICCTRLCALCDTRKEEYYWKTYDTALCRKCFGMIINGETVIGLNDLNPLLIAKIERQPICKPQISRSCGLLHSWIKR